MVDDWRKEKFSVGIVSRKFHVFTKNIAIQFSKTITVKNINRLRNSGYNDARNMFAKYHTAFQIEVLVITKVLIIHFNTYIVRSII